MLAACVALVVHPDDDRYSHLVGKTVTSPVFGVRVPVKSHRLADPEKGTGIAMICTFGDIADVVWWRELNLPLRSILDKDGKLTGDTPEWLTNLTGRTAYERIAGKRVKTARTESINLLTEHGAIKGEPRATQRDVKFYEKGDQPIEIVSTRQWYIKNGSSDETLKVKLYGRGKELNWHPDYMRSRYDNWIDGLSADWLISRQRYFGVPFPIWYPLASDGEVIWDRPIVPTENELPVDPQSAAPEGFEESQRGKPGGFVGDPDVMDTWATSSLTPYIACGWEDDQDLFEQTYPMDMRPQAHEIIRTWLFNTVLRAELESHELPWKNASISGWILDPDRKKMSKSKGNVVTPQHLIDQYGADGVRYWAALARPGTDTAFDEKQMKTGRRLAVKLMNAARFSLESNDRSADSWADITHPLDQAAIASVRGTVDQATDQLNGFDYASALNILERSFWSFCDFYIELSKERVYGAEGKTAKHSAQATLRIAIEAYIRCLAPYLPFIAEEVWGKQYNTSVHAEPWPTLERAMVFSSTTYEYAIEALRVIRAVKGRENITVGTPIEWAELTLPKHYLDGISPALSDIRYTTRADSIRVVVGDSENVDATIGGVSSAIAWSDVSIHGG